MIEWPHRLSNEVLQEMTRRWRQVPQEPGYLAKSIRLGAQEPAKRTTVARPGCLHMGRVEVTLLLTGELVAWLCPECDAQLDADYSVPEIPILLDLDWIQTRDGGTAEVDPPRQFGTDWLNTVHERSK